jgi:predicted RNase H-like nuclease
VRFLGVDLAWKEHNPSGVVVLEGLRFPLRLVEGPRTLPTHTAVLDWLAGWLDRPGPRLATAVGIDAPLLGLAGARGRRECDDEVSRLFGRFAASVHSLSAFRGMLRCFAAQLQARAQRILPRRSRRRVGSSARCIPMLRCSSTSTAAGAEMRLQAAEVPLQREWSRRARAVRGEVRRRW